MNKLIKNIWEKYHKTSIPQKMEEKILKKANASYKKAKGKYKLSTFISWWTRQYINKK